MPMKHGTEEGKDSPTSRASLGHCAIEDKGTKTREIASPPILPMRAGAPAFVPSLDLESEGATTVETRTTVTGTLLCLDCYLCLAGVTPSQAAIGVTTEGVPKQVQ